VEVLCGTAVCYNSGLPAVATALGTDPRSQRRRSRPRLFYAPISMPIPSASSRGLSADGKWRPLFNRCLSAWDWRHRGTGQIRPSSAPLRRCLRSSRCSLSSLTDTWLGVQTLPDGRGLVWQTRPDLLRCSGAG
jgi:hypothetical protein